MNIPDNILHASYTPIVIYITQQITPKLSTLKQEVFIILQFIHVRNLQVLLQNE